MTPSTARAEHALSRAPGAGTLTERTGTVIVGAGQAGLALSHELTARGVRHVVLERGRIGERWRSERWESLTLLTPGWLNRLPGEALAPEPDGFETARELVDRLDAYAWSFTAPVVEGVTVRRARRSATGVTVETSRGTWLADDLVVATGDCGAPVVPGAAASIPAGLRALHASAFRSPAALPPGGVLVVGAGPSGQQLALELARAGRRVVLAVGRHARVPRRYRGVDVFRWLERLGDLDRTIDEVPDPEAALRSPSLPLTGAGGGEQLDLAVLRDAGVTLTGRLDGFRGDAAVFADDLEASVADAERRLARLLARVERHIDEAGLEPPPYEGLPAVHASGAPTSVDLRAEGISTVIWATGYRRSYPWLDVPVLDGAGEIVHRRGVTPVDGVYALGLRFQWRRSSHFIGGVGHDAAYLAKRIAARARCDRARRFTTARAGALRVAAR